MRNVFIILICAFLSMGAASDDFDGTDDEITMGNVLNVTTGNVSTCAWHIIDEDASRDHVAGKKNADVAGGAGYRIYQTSGDLITMQVSDGVDQQTSIGGDYDAVWIWACGTWLAASEVTEIWVNGVLEDTDTGAGAVGSLSNAVDYQLGESHADDDDLNGRIAYVKNFAAVITGVEINELMWKPESIIINTPNGLWALWGDRPEVDLSGNGNAGTIVGGTTANSDGPKVMFGGGLPI